LSSLGFSHALLEFIHATCRVDELLLAGVKWVTSVANTHDDHWLGGAGLDHVAARATDLCIHIFRMNILFHKRPHRIPLVRRLTSWITTKLGIFNGRGDGK